MSKKALVFSLFSFLLAACSNEPKSQTSSYSSSSESSSIETSSSTSVESSDQSSKEQDDSAIESQSTSHSSEEIITSISDQSDHQSIEENDTSTSIEQTATVESIAPETVEPSESTITEESSSSLEESSYRPIEESSEPISQETDSSTIVEENSQDSAELSSSIIEESSNQPSKTQTSQASEEISSSPEPIPANNRVIVDKLYNGDAKFFKDKIITSVGDTVTLVNLDGQIERKYRETKASWIDVEEDENFIVYGNFSNQIGIIRFDESYNIISNQVIMTTEHLQIDPTINKVDGTYYLSATEVIGKANRSDPSMENGEYILHLYTSSNLQDWSLVSNITEAKNNIEDIDISVIDKKIYAVYEKEEIDKGNSSIMLKTSSDFGMSWGEEIELLPSDCDHEPATFASSENTFLLYYSCDKDYPGESYMGAKAYYATYDQDFNLIEKDHLIETITEKGILLYDTRFSGEYFYLLYAKDYLSSRDLAIERMKIEA